MTGVDQMIEISGHLSRPEARVLTACLETVNLHILSQVAFPLAARRWLYLLAAPENAYQDFNGSKNIRAVRRGLGRPLVRPRSELTAFIVERWTWSPVHAEQRITWCKNTGRYRNSFWPSAIQRCDAASP